MEWGVCVVYIYMSGPIIFVDKNVIKT